jgi:hypothetical protein
LRNNYLPKDPLVIKPVVESDSTLFYNSSVKLQLNIDAHVSYTGQITGVKYEWERAGSIAVVDAQDASYLLEKRIKSQACCSGSQMDTPIFTEVD